MTYILADFVAPVVYSLCEERWGKIYLVLNNILSVQGQNEALRVSLTLSRQGVLDFSYGRDIYMALYVETKSLVRED